MTAADGSETTYSAICDAMKALGVFPPTIHRALRHRMPLNKGPYRGWKFRYEDTPMPDPPEVVEGEPVPADPGPYPEYPTSRYDALQQEVLFYYTGKPCKRGHIALRKVQGACTECLKMAWHAAKDTRKPYFEEYRHRPEVVARAKQYYKNIKANKAAQKREEKAVEISTPLPNPTYKELMEQARVKPRT